MLPKVTVALIHEEIGKHSEKISKLNLLLINTTRKE